MAYIVKVVEDEVLGADPGWVMARTDDGDTYFLVEESAASSEEVLADAWAAARLLEENNRELARAVTDGHRFGDLRIRLAQHY